MKRKGFTLIELLAVIVVLAIIAIIAIPIITSVIDKAKVGALKDSAYGIIEAGELYLANNLKDGIEDTIEFTCSNGKCINGDKEITYKGQIETGRIRIYSDNKIELCITDNKNSALKKVTEKEVIVETGTCKYNELSYDVSALVSKDDYDKVVNELSNIKKDISKTTATNNDIISGATAITNSYLINNLLTTGSLNTNNNSYGTCEANTKVELGFKPNYIFVIGTNTSDSRQWIAYYLNGNKSGYVLNGANGTYAASSSYVDFTIYDDGFSINGGRAMQYVAAE